MAIIAEYHGERGGTVYIADDELKKLTAEELEANRESFYSVARSIFEGAAVRELREKKLLEN